MVNWIQVKDCKRFSKRCYQLPKKIDYRLIQLFDDLGELNITVFSKYSDNANDIFKIRMLDLLEISGALNDCELFATVSKESNELWGEVENRLFQWI